MTERRRGSTPATRDGWALGAVLLLAMTVRLAACASFGDDTMFLWSETTLIALLLLFLWCFDLHLARGVRRR